VADEGLIARATAAADYIAGGVSTPSQSIALHALRQSDKLVDRCRKIVQANVKILADWIRRRPELAWVEPDAGTVALLKLPAHMDAMRLSNHLREKYSTLVVPGDFFWIKGFVRVSLGIEEETLKAGLKNLAAAVDELKPTR
jgi:aspartate/methionine/tyrosine aminotransferase